MILFYLGLVGSYELVTFCQLTFKSGDVCFCLLPLLLTVVQPFDGLFLHRETCV